MGKSREWVEGPENSCGRGANGDNLFYCHSLIHTPNGLSKHKIKFKRHR